MRVEVCQGLRGRLVERDHRVGRNLEPGLVEQPRLVGRREDARAERLREHERVALARPRVGEHPRERHEARHRETVLGLVVVDRVASRHHAARLAAPLGPARQDLARHLDAKAVGKAQQVERERGRPSHGPDVGEGVGGRHPAKEVRVVHHRREEVAGLHETAAVTQVVDAGVVRGVEAHEEPLVGHARQIAEHLRERAGRQLGRAPRRLHQLREPHAVHVHVAPPVPLAPGSHPPAPPTPRLPQTVHLGHLMAPHAPLNWSKCTLSQPMATSSQGSRRNQQPGHPVANGNQQPGYPAHPASYPSSAATSVAPRAPA